MAFLEGIAGLLLDKQIPPPGGIFFDKIVKISIDSRYIVVYTCLITMRD
jgi:hypothetical protein